MSAKPRAVTSVADAYEAAALGERVGGVMHGPVMFRRPDTGDCEALVALLVEWNDADGLSPRKQIAEWPRVREADDAIRAFVQALKGATT